MPLWCLSVPLCFFCVTSLGILVRELAIKLELGVKDGLEEIRSSLDTLLGGMKASGSEIGSEHNGPVASNF